MKISIFFFQLETIYTYVKEPRTFRIHGETTFSSMVRLMILAYSTLVCTHTHTHTHTLLLSLQPGLKHRSLSRHKKRNHPLKYSYNQRRQSWWADVLCGKDAVMTTLSQQALKSTTHTDLPESCNILWITKNSVYLFK